MQIDQIRRREFITLVGGAASWPLAAHAQQATKVYRVAYLDLFTASDSTVVTQRLHELGYGEGKNLIFDHRTAEGRSERLPQLAAEFVSTNPDVLVAGAGTLTAKALQSATATIPIVFTSVGDAIGAGIVKSLNRPGANITGVSTQSSELVSRRLQVLRELIPGIRVVAVLMNPDTPFTALALQELRIAAAAGGQDLEVFETRTADQLSTNIEAAVRARANGLMTLEDPLLRGLRQQISDLAAKVRLPTIYGTKDFVEAGGLISYGVDRREVHRRAAEFIDKILKGAKPADIPVEQPTKFELIINLKTAKVLGLTVPSTLLALADEVIE
jgi:putative ABC transport system substrate-binding protein